MLKDGVCIDPAKHGVGLGWSAAEMCGRKWCEVASGGCKRGIARGEVVGGAKEVAVLFACLQFICNRLEDQLVVGKVDSEDQVDLDQWMGYNIYTIYTQYMFCSTSLFFVTA